MRLIDADVLANWIDGSQRLDTEHDYEEVARYIEECPTVDAVEVVRCRDCKYKEQNAGRYHVKLPFYCTLHDEKFCDEMEFCSYGAKMDKEDT